MTTARTAHPVRTAELIPLVRDFLRDHEGWNTVQSIRKHIMHGKTDEALLTAIKRLVDSRDAVTRGGYVGGTFEVKAT